MLVATVPVNSCMMMAAAMTSLSATQQFYASHQIAKHKLSVKENRMIWQRH